MDGICLCIAVGAFRGDLSTQTVETSCTSLCIAASEGGKGLELSLSLGRLIAHDDRSLGWKWDESLEIRGGDKINPRVGG